MTPRAGRPYDLIVFGATSFVGEILCRYLVERHGTDGDLRWAIAGRDAGKLDADWFAVAMHLTMQTKRGEPLPKTLPPECVPPKDR